MKVLITGVYGFVGFSVARRLLELGHTVIGVERISNSKSEKTARMKLLSESEKQLEELKEAFGFVPSVSGEEGVKEYVEWYMREGHKC